MKIKNRLHRHDINNPRSRHVVNLRVIQYDDAYMYSATPKQHLQFNS